MTGGSAQSDIWVQIFSDVLNKRIELPVWLIYLHSEQLLRKNGVGAITSFEEAIKKFLFVIGISLQ